MVDGMQEAVPCRDASWGRLALASVPQSTAACDYADHKHKAGYPAAAVSSQEGAIEERGAPSWLATSDDPAYEAVPAGGGWQTCDQAKSKAQAASSSAETVLPAEGLLSALPAEEPVGTLRKEAEEAIGPEGSPAEGGGGRLTAEGGGALGWAAVEGGCRKRSAEEEAAADGFNLEEGGRGGEKKPVDESCASQGAGKQAVGCRKTQGADEEDCEIDTDAASAAKGLKQVKKEACEVGGPAPPTPDAAFCTTGSSFTDGSSEDPDPAEASGEEGHSRKRARVGYTQTSETDDAAKVAAEAEDSGRVSENDAPGLAALQRTSGVRFGKKSRSCNQCGGPCGTVCSTAGQNFKTDPDVDAAAAAFARAVAKHRAGAAAEQFQQEGEQSTAAASERPPTSRKRARAVQGYDGRRKKRRLEQAVSLSFGQLPTWLQDAPRLGNTPIHESHVGHLAWHRGLLWCWQCGCTATVVPNHLRHVCAKPTVAGARQLKRLRLGQTPRNSVRWPLTSDAANALGA